MVPEICGYAADCELSYTSSLVPDTSHSASPGLGAPSESLPCTLQPKCGHDANSSGCPLKIVQQCGKFF